MSNESDGVTNKMQSCSIDIQCQNPQIFKIRPSALHAANTNPSLGMTVHAQKGITKQAGPIRKQFSSFFFHPTLVFQVVNVFDRVTEHTRNIEHYLQSKKHDNDSTTKLSDRRKSVFKESGGWADRIGGKKKKSNRVH